MALPALPAIAGLLSRIGFSAAARTAIGASRAGLGTASRSWTSRAYRGLLRATRRPRARTSGSPRSPGSSRRRSRGFLNELVRGGRRILRNTGRNNQPQFNPFRSISNAINSNNANGFAIPFHQLGDTGENGNVEQAKYALNSFTQALSFAIPVLGMFSNSIRLVHGFANSLVDSQRGTARFSGPMSLSLARLNTSRTFREIDMAKGTEKSFVALVESVNKLEGAMEPWKKSWNITLNKIGETTSSWAQTFLDAGYAGEESWFSNAPMGATERAAWFGPLWFLRSLDFALGTDLIEDGDKARERLQKKEGLADDVLQQMFNMQLVKHQIKNARAPRQGIPDRSKRIHDGTKQRLLNTAMNIGGIFPVPPKKRKP